MGGSRRLQYLTPYLPNSTRGRFLCERILADGSRGLRLPLAAAGPLLAYLAVLGVLFDIGNFNNTAVGKMVATGHDWLIIKCQ